MTEENREVQPPPQQPQPLAESELGIFERGETPERPPTPAGSPGAFGALDALGALSLPEGDPPLPAPRAYSRRSSGDGASALSSCARGRFSDVLEQIQVPR